MKKIKSIVICCMVAMIMSSFEALAAPYNPSQYTSVEVESGLLPSNTRISRVIAKNVLRGAFFASGELTILNNNGKIRVSAKTYMKEPVDEVYLTIYVDRLIDNSWSQVAYYDFEFYAEDYPDGLIDPGVDFTITDQPSGYYYRLRGSYAAIKDGAMEGFGPVTDGVLIE